MLDRFRYLNIGLAAILAFVGGKMLLSEVVEVPTWASLVVIVGALAVAVTASVVRPARPAGLPVTPEAGTPIPPSP